MLINRHRSLLRRGLVEARQLLRLGADAQPVAHQPEDEMVMWAAVRQLPPRQRAVIVLRYYEDLSDLEVARLLGLPLGTVKSLGRLGLGRLRRRLAAPTTLTAGRQGRQP